MPYVVIRVDNLSKFNIPESCYKCSYELASALNCVICNRIVLPSEFDYHAERHPECPIKVFE